MMNTVCGYIDGASGLPATCSAGSHCVLDSEHGVVGCCPDGDSPCTAGVFTGCVDGYAAAAATAEMNPYVYTCSGGSLCYRNSFPDGFYQYGCGSATDMGRTVKLTATETATERGSQGNRLAVTLSSQHVLFTGKFATTSFPNSSIPYSSPSSPSSSTAFLASDTPQSSSVHASRRHTSAIVGGAIVGVAGIVFAGALAAYIVWCKREKKPHRRRGFGLLTSTAYRGPAARHFKNLHGSFEDFEAGMANCITQGAEDGAGHDNDENWATPAIGAVAASRRAYYSPGGSIMGAAAEEEPLQHALDDFARGCRHALSRIGEEDEGGEASEEGEERYDEEDREMGRGDDEEDREMGRGDRVETRSRRGNGSQESQHSLNSESPRLASPRRGQPLWQPS